VPTVSLLAGLSAVAAGGGVAEAGQAGEPERIASAGASFIKQPVGAQVLRSDVGLTHCLVDVAAADGPAAM
jgi:hypothetical protein